MNPKISIGTCQRAIGIVEVASEIATRDLSQWVSGDIRFTPKEKELLTNQARALLADKDKTP